MYYERMSVLFQHLFVFAGVCFRKIVIHYLTYCIIMAVVVL